MVYIFPCNCMSGSTSRQANSHLSDTTAFASWRNQMQVKVPHFEVTGRNSAACKILIFCCSRRSADEYIHNSSSQASLCHNNVFWLHSWSFPHTFYITLKKQLKINCVKSQLGKRQNNILFVTCIELVHYGSLENNFFMTTYFIVLYFSRYLVKTIHVKNFCWIINFY